MKKWISRDGKLWGRITINNWDTSGIYTNYLWLYGYSLPWCYPPNCPQMTIRLSEPPVLGGELWSRLSINGEWSTIPLDMGMCLCVAIMWDSQWETSHTVKGRQLLRQNLGISRCPKSQFLDHETNKFGRTPITHVGMFTPGDSLKWTVWTG